MPTAPGPGGVMYWSGRFVDRQVPSAEIAQLFDLTAQIAETEFADVDAVDREHAFPAAAYRTLGESGLLGLPYSSDYGGANLAAEFSLQVLEELSYNWLAVGIGVSVHNLACYPVAEFGTPEQRERFLPALLGGERLGGYCLSEPQSGSDAAALQTRAELTGDSYTVSGQKAWITHGNVADDFAVMVRTGDATAKGISCLMIDAASPGFEPDAPERKMGNMSSPTCAIRLSNVHVPVDRRIGQEGEGFTIALQALDSGRLGIAACAVGLAQAALDYAVAYGKTRMQFGQPITNFQGVSFPLADMAAAIYAARCAYVDAARRKDQGLEFNRQAAMAKLLATDTAMDVTSRCINVLGGAGYTQDHRVERFFREAKVLQIVEGTNQIQRLVIGRSLTA
jgi:alkylation response protein AidB-like acyl-CoA dehydrogenase